MLHRQILPKPELLHPRRQLRPCGRSRADAPPSAAVREDLMLGSTRRHWSTWLDRCRHSSFSLSMGRPHHRAAKLQWDDPASRRVERPEGVTPSYPAQRVSSASSARPAGPHLVDHLLRDRGALNDEGVLQRREPAGEMVRPIGPHSRRGFQARAYDRRRARSRRRPDDPRPPRPTPPVERG